MGRALAKFVVLSPGQQLPDPPYPADTRAKGWRFEIDYERVKQSATWAVTPPEIRPWLLILWCEAWACSPCGCLENDDAVIAGRIGMPINLFRAHRDVLMRGWRLHSDGRLYHEVVSERVICLMLHRKRESDWKAAQRASRKTQSVNNHTVTENVHMDSAWSPPVVHAPVPVPEPEVKKKETSPRSNRGTRLAASSLPDLERTWDMFRDHWAAASGKTACKSDWLAAWRNWVRNEVKWAPQAKKNEDPFAGAI
jgi:hypothetical protein